MVLCVCVCVFACQQVERMYPVYWRLFETYLCHMMMIYLDIVLYYGRPFQLSNNNNTRIDASAIQFGTCLQTPLMMHDQYHAVVGSVVGTRVVNFLLLLFVICNQGDNNYNNKRACQRKWKKKGYKRMSPQLTSPTVHNVNESVHTKKEFVCQPSFGRDEKGAPLCVFIISAVYFIHNYTQEVMCSKITL